MKGHIYTDSISSCISDQTREKCPRPDRNRAFGGSGTALQIPYSLLYTDSKSTDPTAIFGVFRNLFSSFSNV